MAKFEEENEQLKERIREVENDSNNCEHWSYERIKQLEAQIEKMKCCGNCKYLTRKLLNCENIQICKVNPNNIYGVCDIWEL